MGTLPVTAGAKEINWFAAMRPAEESPAEAAAPTSPASFTASVVADAAVLVQPEATLPHHFVYPEAVAQTFTPEPEAKAEVGADLNQMLSALDNQLSETLAKIVEDAQTAHKPRTLFGVQLGTRGAAPGLNLLAGAPAQSQPQSARRERFSKARLEAYAQAHTLTREQLIGKGTKDHPWALVYHTRDQEGSKGVMDALELIVLRQGSAKMQQWLLEMVRTADAAIALSAILAATSEVGADRLLGIFLLTTDGLNGRVTVNEAWARMAASVDGGLRLAQFLETSSRHPVGGRGLLELLDTLSSPEGEDWSEAARLATTFRGLAHTLGGARRLNQSWENLLEHDNGAVILSRMFQRMTRTQEGALSLLETWHNLAHDNDGAAQLGRVLSRVSEGKEGARELLKGLAAMASHAAGQREVVRLFVRLAEGAELGRLLAALAKDAYNAYHLSALLQQLTHSSAGRRLVHYAFERTAYSHRQRSCYQLFIARIARCQRLPLPGLESALEASPLETLPLHR